MAEMTREEKIAKIIELKTTLVATQREFYKKKFFEFNRDVMMWPDIYEPLHRKVCNFIQDNIETKKILLLLPRGCFKSSIVTVGYSTWQIAKDPSSRGLIANATYPMAITFLGQIKNVLLKNEKFVEIYGDMAKNADSWREDRFSVASEKSYESKAATLTAAGIGSNMTGAHFDYAILDDLVNRDNIGTREQIERVINMYRDVMDLVDPQANGHKKIIVIGTTWHQSDLYSWIEDPETGIFDDFAVMKLPAYTGEFGTGELLFPTRLTWDVLDNLKKQQGSSHFSAQYMLDPVPTETAVFKSNFKYYEETDLRGVELNKFICIDPAISEKNDADYSAMACVGVDKNNVWYILDLWRERVQPNRLIDQVFYWDEKWKPISIGLETVAFQKTLQYTINDEMKKRNRFIPIKELKGRTASSKEDRIRGLEPRYEIGTVFHNKQLPFNTHLEDELRRFPKGKNDDLIDALSSLLELTFPPRKHETRGEKRNYSNYPA